MLQGPAFADANSKDEHPLGFLESLLGITGLLSPKASTRPCVVTSRPTALASCGRGSTIEPNRVLVSSGAGMQDLLECESAVI
jgi:hypothetical protein